MGKADMNGQPIVRSVASRARKIEEAMAGRVGRPGKEIKQHVAEFESGQSRDIAAAVGMSGEQAARCGFFVVRMVAKKLGENWERNAQNCLGKQKRT